MKDTLTTTQSADMLLADENANWSYAGAIALVEYIESIEAGTGEEIEFDRVAIRCDYSEYESLQAWAKEYHGTEYKLEIDEAIRDYISDRGQLIEFVGGVIVSSF